MSVWTIHTTGSTSVVCSPIKTTHIWSSPYVVMCANARGHVAITRYVAGTIDVAVVARLLGPSQSPPADPLKQLAASIVSPKYLYTLRLPSTLHTGIPTTHAARPRAPCVLLQRTTCSSWTALDVKRFVSPLKPTRCKYGLQVLNVRPRDWQCDECREQQNWKHSLLQNQMFSTEIVKGFFFLVYSRNCHSLLYRS